MINHFNTKLTSPAISLISGYVFMITVGLVLYFLGFYDNSKFFSWGIPVNFMGTTVNDYNTYFTLIFMIFLHQMINNWINSVTYPWIINCVQDPKSRNLVYSTKVSLLLVNMFALYSELDVVIILSGIMSQVTFFISIIVANLITTSIINWKYIYEKRDILSENNSLV